MTGAALVIDGGYTLAVTRPSRHRAEGYSLRCGRRGSSLCMKFMSSAREIFGPDYVARFSRLIIEQVFQICGIMAHEHQAHG